MVVFRFMKADDLLAFNSGVKLKNETDHSLSAKTNSKGFCFLSLDDFKPEDAFHFLSGIVDMEVCAVFETKKKLNKTYGFYADSSRDKELRENGVSILDWLDLFEQLADPTKRKTVKINEYCSTELSNKDFKLLKYAKPNFMEDDWEWIDFEESRT